MAEAVMDHSGTLDLHMGDGIMAVFGAPLEQSDHADRAMASAGRCSSAGAGIQRLDARAWGEGRLPDRYRS